MTPDEELLYLECACEEVRELIRLVAARSPKTLGVWRGQHVVGVSILETASGNLIARRQFQKEDVIGAVQRAVWQSTIAHWATAAGVVFDPLPTMADLVVDDPEAVEFCGRELRLLLEALR